MRSVPGAVATGSRGYNLGSGEGGATRSLPLPVLTSQKQKTRPGSIEPAALSFPLQPDSTKDPSRHKRRAGR